MSDLSTIKKRIAEEEKVEEILEAIGCEYISEEQAGTLITAMLPHRYDSPNKRAVQVRLNESTYSVIRNIPEFKGGSIFDLVSFIQFEAKTESEMTSKLNESKKFICKLLGWEHYLKGNSAVEERVDHLAPMREILRREKKRKEKKKVNPVLPQSVMYDYYLFNKPLPYQGWIDEGISYNTQAMYGVGFDLESKRVVFPLCNRFGEIVGVKGRIMRDEDSDRKYMYLHKCLNSLEWFNFHYALPFIASDRFVYVFEAEKSCMKAFDRGIFNTVAIGASDISSQQVKTMKNIGLDVKIILCYDKGITFDAIKEQAKLFEGRKVYAMYDMDNLLQDRESPMDAEPEVWEKLRKNNVYEIDFEDEEDED